MHKSLTACLLLPLSLSACKTQQKQQPIVSTIESSGILAADISQNHMAQEKDAYSALLATAANDAILFLPEPSKAKPWLKTQSPLINTSWQPHKIYLSCGGKSGVVTGAIKWRDIDGYYTTVWHYFPKASGGSEWRWLLSHGDRVEHALKKVKSVQIQTASCEYEPPATIITPDVGVQMKQGLSRDQSLSWTWQYFPDKSHILVVKLWDGEKSIAVLTDTIAG